MAHMLSIFCVFVCFAGIAWNFCERGSDLGTPRWRDDRRFFSFILRFAVFFIAAVGLPEYLLRAPLGRSETLAWAISFGMACGFFGYYIYRRFISPRPADEDDETTSNTVLKTSRPFKKKRLSWQAWLLLDFAVLKEHFKNNRAKKSDENKSKK